MTYVSDAELISALREDAKYVSTTFGVKVEETLQGRAATRLAALAPAHDKSEPGEGATVRRSPVVTDEMAGLAWLAYDSTPNGKMRAAIEAAMRAKP